MALEHIREPCGLRRLQSALGRQKCRPVVSSQGSPPVRGDVRLTAARSSAAPSSGRRVALQPAEVPTNVPRQYKSPGLARGGRPLMHRPVKPAGECRSRLSFDGKIHSHARIRTWLLKLFHSPRGKRSQARLSEHVVRAGKHLGYRIWASRELMPFFLPKAT